MSHPSLGLAILRLLGRMFYGLVDMLSSKENCQSLIMRIGVRVDLPMKRGTPPRVLAQMESDAFEGPVTTPVLLNQSRAFSMLPWGSQATPIRTASPCQHLATASQASSHPPHEAPGRNQRQMFHLAPQHGQISAPFAAAARREHSMIALVEPADRPDSSEPT